jgi:putative hemolysin
MRCLIKWKMIVIVIILIFIVSSIKVIAENSTRPIPNIVNPIQDPSVKYCKDMGYEWSLAPGGSSGVCKFPDGSSAGDWDFLEGNAGENWSYCTKKGYELKTLSNDSKCISALNPNCSVCVLSNGTEVEATLLMKSEGFIAKKCGNGICETNESYDNCPQDCKKIEKPYMLYAIVFSIVVILIVVTLLYMRRRKVEYVYKKP